MLNDSAVPVPLVCLAVPLHRSEVIGSVAGTGPSCAQGSTVPPEEEVLSGTGGPQGSALGGVTATGGGEEEMEGRGRVNATQPQTGHEMHGEARSEGGWEGGRGSRKLGWVSAEAFLSLTSDLTPLGLPGILYFKKKIKYSNAN